MNKKQHKEVVIVGGGTAGWMTAAALVRLLPRNEFTICLIESEQIGTVGVGEATIPHLRYFNERLGIDERAFLKATSATFKLGIRFDNWARLGDSYLHPFGDFAEPINGVDFHHVWRRFSDDLSYKDFAKYSLPIEMSNRGVFDYPVADSSSIQSSYSYAYHIDATAYAQFLRTFAESLGVVRREGVVQRVSRDVNTGDISAVYVDGERIEGDLFVDCTGFRSVLLGNVLGVKFDDWSHYLPCNRAIAIAGSKLDNPPPYTVASAAPFGWRWQIPLTRRTGNGIVYCDDFVSDQQAQDYLIEQMSCEPASEPNHLRFVTGKRQVSWHKNCVAIGLSSGFLEPLESTSIYLIQAAIMKLLELFPEGNSDADVKRDEYNRAMNHELERIRDFLILHYHATERTDSPFWNQMRTMNIPESLSERMSIFAQTGQHLNYDTGLFLKPSWISVYLGQRRLPNHVDPRTAGFDENQVKTALTLMRDEVNQAASKMMPHEKSLRQPSTHRAAAHNSLYGLRRGYENA